MIDSPWLIATGQPVGRRSEPLALGLIALIWIVQFLSFSLERILNAPEAESWARLGARALVTVIGILISLGILKVLQRCAGMSFLKRALIALALALGGAAIHSLANWQVFSAIMGPGPDSSFSAEAFASLVYLFSWVYLAVTVVLLSLTYGEELLRRERRISELRSEADRAQLSAFRYQLNPHFLFNALNSAASLVSAQRNSEAEAMLENLADFLRATLKLDGGSEITLREELELQSGYLEVERSRFPHRLRIEKDVPKQLLDVRIPNLITQPLIENSIKHAVAQSTEPVCLTISARGSAGKIEICVKDSGGNAEGAVNSGTGVGLRNVAKRLELHFGAEARFTAGPTADGGFESVISMPMRRQS